MQFKHVPYFLLFLLASICQAQEIQKGNDVLESYFELDSWETEDLKNSEALSHETKGLIFPISSISLSLIRFYQERVSPNSSMNRCPYKTSCSLFAYRSISSKGFLVGVLLFIDRYYYRENSNIAYNYPLYEKAGGVLKLNDDYYLTGEKY